MNGYIISKSRMKEEDGICPYCNGKGCKACSAIFLSQKDKITLEEHK